MSGDKPGKPPEADSTPTKETKPEKVKSKSSKKGA